MAKTTSKDTSVVSLRHLSLRTGINYMKVRNNIEGKYNSLSPQEKAELVNAFFDDVTPFLQKLGYFIVVKRLKVQDPQP